MSKLEDRTVFPIADPKLAQIYSTRSCPGISTPVAEFAHLIAHALVRTPSILTLEAFVTVRRIGPNRYAAEVGEGWFVTFSWDWDFHLALDARIERLQQEA
jgi:hypothetical protein